MKKQWTTVLDFIQNGKVSSKYKIVNVEGMNQVGDGGQLSLVRTGNVGTPSQSFLDTGNNTCIDKNGDVWEVQKGDIVYFNGSDDWFGNGFGSKDEGTYLFQNDSWDRVTLYDDVGYMGLWGINVTKAYKGQVVQTQAGGTPTGQYFTALQNTTVDPVGDDVNWCEVVSVDSLSQYAGIIYNSVSEMLAGSINVSSIAGVKGYYTPGDGGNSAFIFMGSINLPQGWSESNGDLYITNSSLESYKLLNDGYVEPVKMGARKVKFSSGSVSDVGDDASYVISLIHNAGLFIDISGCVRWDTPLDTLGAPLRLRGGSIDSDSILVTSGTGTHIDNLGNYFTVEGGVTIRKSEPLSVGSPVVINKTGLCINAADKGSSYANIDNLRIDGFENSGFIRRSLWWKVGKIESLGAGDRPFSFVRLNKDGSEPTQGWNFLDDGWFNNAHSIQSFVCKGCENAPILILPTCNIDLLSIEAQAGNGVEFDGGPRSGGLGEAMRPLTIGTYYVESIYGHHIRAKDSIVKITSMFSQGNKASQGAPGALSVVNCDNSTVDIDNFSSQQFYRNLIVASNNSKVTGEITGSLFTAAEDKYSVDSTSIYIPTGTSEHCYYDQLTIPSNGSETISGVASDSRGLYDATVGIIYDGGVNSVVRWIFYRFNGSTVRESVTNNTPGLVGLDVDISGDDLVISNTNSLPVNISISFENLKLRSYNSVNF